MPQPRLAIVLLAAMLISTAAAPTWALDPPPSDPDRCGGLVCDLGLFKGRGDPHALPCNDFFCRSFGGGNAPPPAPVATAPAPDPIAPPHPAKARHARARAPGPKASPARQTSAPRTSAPRTSAPEASAPEAAAPAATPR